MAQWLEAAGLAVSGGQWETMPTSYPPSKEPILASVPASPEPAIAAAEVEPDPESELDAAARDGLDATTTSHVRATCSTVSGRHRR
ncbi:hypothetical protein [Nannocystis pusilla]|uniref:hypothetical protein n=1 Tax=Nannocystis pusilla TaxID=889268 RepID=UPI003B7608D0